MYLHIYNCVYIKCLYKWERWAARTPGTPCPRDATGQTGGVGAPSRQLGGSKRNGAGERLRRGAPRPSSAGCQLGPTAQTWGWGGEQEGRAPGGSVQEHQNPRGQEGCPRACRPREDWDEVTRQDLGVPCPAFRGHTLSHGSHGTPAASGRSPGEAGCLRCELRHRSTASVSQR